MFPRISKLIMDRSCSSSRDGPAEGFDIDPDDDTYYPCVEPVNDDFAIKYAEGDTDTLQSSCFLLETENGKPLPCIMNRCVAIKLRSS